MTPAWMALVGVVLAFVGGVWATDRTAARWWQLGALLGVLVVAGGLLRPAPESALGEVVLTAQVGGAPAVTRVVVEPAEQRRAVYAVPLERVVAGAPVALGTMVLLGLLGLILRLRWPSSSDATRDAGARLTRLVTVVGALAALAAAAAFWSASGTASGEAGVRAWLQGALSGVTIQSFTVPEGTWSFPGGAPAAACLAVALLALPAVLRGAKAPSAAAGVLVPIGAALTLAGAAWQLLAAGGPWWSALDGLLIGAALLISGARFLASEPAYGALLAGAAAGLAALAVGIS